MTHFVEVAINVTSKPRDQHLVLTQSFLRGVSFILLSDGQDWETESYTACNMIPTKGASSIMAAGIAALMGIFRKK